MSIWAISSTCIVDEDNPCSVVINGDYVDLRPQCWSLLLALIEAKKNDRILTFELIGEAIWPSSGGWDSARKGLLDGILGELRRVIGKELIHNKSKVGYYLANEIIEIKSSYISDIDEKTISQRYDQNIEEEFTSSVDILVAKLESIQKKIDITIKNKNQVWTKIYTAQFDIAYAEFLQLSYDYFTLKSKRAPQKLVSTTNLINRANALEASLEEAIMICLTNCSDTQLIDILDNLPKNRESALMLLSLLDSFEIIELYHSLLFDFDDFLTSTEISIIKNRVTEIFDQEMLNLWGIS